MRPSEVTSAPRVLTNIQKTAFLWGPPGVGESQIVAQVGTSLGVRLIGKWQRSRAARRARSVRER